MISSLEDVPDLQTDITLAPYTTWKVGGPASYFWEAQRKYLPDVLKYCNENEIEVYFLGRGSNTLISDGGLDGLVISTIKSLQDISLDDGIITAEAGVSMPTLSAFAAQQGHSGYEFMIGIPGSVGAGVAINAGLSAHGREEIRDILIDVTVLDKKGNQKTQSVDELEFGYRWSNIPERDLFVLSAQFLSDSRLPLEEIHERCTSILEERKGKQPLTYPTAGSVFKQPEGGRAAGWYLDEAGLKGYQIGGAQISKKHANWILNVDDATAQDIIQLIEHMVEMVEREFGITLEREVKIFS